MELALPPKEDLVYTTRNLSERLRQQITHRLSQSKKDFSGKTQRLNSPERALQSQRERIEDLMFNLEKWTKLSQRQLHENLTSLDKRLLNKNPKYEVLRSQNLLYEKDQRCVPTDYCPSNPVLECSLRFNLPIRIIHSVDYGFGLAQELPIVRDIIVNV